MKPVDQIKLLQAISGLGHAMVKIKNCVEPGRIADNNPNKQLYSELAQLCILCTDIASKVADEFLQGNQTYDLSSKA